MSRNSKVYARSIDGLVDALFDQLQDIRDGISTPAEAEVFARNAELIIQATDASQRAKALQMSHDQEMARIGYDTKRIEKG